MAEEKTETAKQEEKKTEIGKEDGKMQKETGKENKKEDKKKVVEIKPKEKAIVNGESLRISTKFSIAICKMISRKSPDKAIELLEGVVKERMPVRMASSEVAHQKSRGMKNIAGAKFPKKAAAEIIDLLKQLKANSVVNGIENPVITIARADRAARPFRSGGRKAKRTHVYLEAREFKPTAPKGVPAASTDVPSDEGDAGKKTKSKEKGKGDKK